MKNFCELWVVKNNSGLGLIQVMVAAIVVAIFSVVLLQKVRAQAQISLIADLIRFRDYALNYYYSVAANRASWKCMKEKVDKVWHIDDGLYYDGNLFLNDRILYGTKLSPTAPDDGVSVALYNIDCEPIFASPYDGSDGGGGFTMETDLGAGLAECGGDGLYFCLSAKAFDDGKKSVKLELTVSFLPDKHPLTSMKLASRSAVLFMSAGSEPEQRDCASYMKPSWTNPKFYDDRGLGKSLGKGVLSFLGDAAATRLNAETKGTKCAEAPLVIPPCYVPDDPVFSGSAYADVDDIVYLKALEVASDKALNLLKIEKVGDKYYPHKDISFNLAGKCENGVADPDSIGRCPLTAEGGVRGVIGFDKSTGLTKCSEDFILLKTKDDDGNSILPACNDDVANAVIGVLDSGEVLCSYSSGNGKYGAVQPYVAGDKKIIKGWDTDGKQTGVADFEGGGTVVEAIKYTTKEGTLQCTSGGINRACENVTCYETGVSRGYYSRLLKITKYTNYLCKYNELFICMNAEYRKRDPKCDTDSPSDKICKCPGTNHIWECSYPHDTGSTVFICAVGIEVATLNCGEGASDNEDVVCAPSDEGEGTHGQCIMACQKGKCPNPQGA